MPGPPPKPTHLKLIAGNPGKRALNKAEAKVPLAIPEPPPELSAEARQEWDQMSLRLLAAGLLTAIDKAVLVGYCQAYGRWRQAERVLAEMAKRDQLTLGLMIKTTNGNAIPNPMLGTANKAMSDMIRYGLELGMSPAARSRVRANVEKQGEDAAESFFG